MRLLVVHGLRHVECLQESERLISRLRGTHEATLQSVAASHRAIVDSRAILLRFSRTFLPQPIGFVRP